MEKETDEEWPKFLENAIVLSQEQWDWIMKVLGDDEEAEND